MSKAHTKENNMGQVKLLTTQQAADILNLSKGALEKWRLEGAPEPGLPVVRLGRSIRYRYQDLLAFIESNLSTSTSEDQVNE